MTVIMGQGNSHPNGVYQERPDPEGMTNSGSSHDDDSSEDESFGFNLKPAIKIKKKVRFQDPIQVIESPHESSSGIASDGHDSHSKNTFTSGSSTPQTGYSSSDQSFSSHDGHSYFGQLANSRRMVIPTVESSPLSFNGRGYSPHLDLSRHSTPSPSQLSDTDRLIGYSHARKKRQRGVALADLPDDVILRILSKLPTNQLCRCARVCRRWYHLAWDPMLWTKIRINASETLNVDRALKILTRRLSYETPHVCITVERINLNGCARLTDKGLHFIAKRCPELRHLEMQGCTHVTNTALFEVVSRCVNMEYLDVTGCSGITCISLTAEASIQALSPNSKQIFLRYLDMTDCFALEDSGLNTIALHCTQVQYLYLRRCVRITDIGVQCLANYCTSVKELSISDCRKVTDFGLRELSRLEGNLRYLSVAKCDKVSDVGVKYIAKHCPKLRYLNVRGCEAVSDDSLELLAVNCTRLKSLDVGKCDISDDGLQTLAENCPQLKKLSLKSCEAITNEGIISLANHCRRLQQLNIQDCHVTVEAYKAVKKQCKRCLIEHTNPGFL